MADLPSGQPPPRIAGPVQGAAPVAATGHGGRREPDQDPRQRQPGGRSGSPAASPDAPDAGPPAVPDPLVQALDRLRATNELRPVDLEMARVLRGMREYAANTPTGGHPILPPADPIPPSP